MSDSPTSETRSKADTNKLVYVAGIAFAITCVAFFFASSWLRPTVQEGFPVTNQAKANSDGTFEITIDTSNRNNWIPLNLGAGRISSGKEEPDLTFRRYVAQAPGGAIDLGKVALEDAALAAQPTWVKDEFVDGELQNEALSTWYSYSYWTHLLSPKGRIYAVKLQNGGVAFLQFVSYYCKPEGSGCLTIRYKLANG
ncbi:MAG TPA: hypothetical protein EYN66_05370 [Myxococcales bacterium]|nr:hypothetical protein [Myxococcales bacterium]